jgi:hypothetical protein
MRVITPAPETVRLYSTGLSVTVRTAGNEFSTTSGMFSTVTTPAIAITAKTAILNIGKLFIELSPRY